MKFKTVVRIWEILNITNFGASLERPVIKFNRSRRHDGSYDGNTMRFNLADTKGFAAVVELVYHEMVHQYIYDVLDIEHDHGPVFQEHYRKFLTDDIQADPHYV
jgi:predicted SprT family Zn-dependent metalloprotease